MNREENNIKPLGIKAYGSIGHLPNSRLGPSDRCVHEGQARICTESARDKYDHIIVQEKLDGSCTAVAMIDDDLVALGRAGYLAETSPYLQHQMFAEWVKTNEERFRDVLHEGERIVGEWLAQAHGTIYDLDGIAPWAAFDIIRGHERMLALDVATRVAGIFRMPHFLHMGGPITTEEAMRIHEAIHWPCDETEGVVYRVERKGRVDFLAKWVKPTKVDGKYLPEISGKEAVWNWRNPQ